MASVPSAASSRNRFDAIVVGAGHNGLVAAAYLARGGLKVALLESRPILGGPVGTYEFLPGYRAAFTNSPGSLEQKVVRDLDLAAHGLRFIRPDPTLVHRCDDRVFIGWRDRARVAAQLDACAPGEAARYSTLLSDLEALAQALGISLYAPARDLEAARARLSRTQAELFDQVFYGSLRDLLDARLRSVEAKTLLGMVGLNVGFALPSTTGTAAGLMLRPIALASSPPSGADDPRGSALRGSTGLPVGGMGALVDALESACLAHGVEIRRNTRIASILHDEEGVSGVVGADGETFHARTVVSAINPRAAFRLLCPGGVPDEMRVQVEASPLQGSAFKLVLALDGVPDYAGLPEGLANEEAARTQFRIAGSLDHIESVIRTAKAGLLPERPLIWGLIPSVTSPELAPRGRHLLSANVWHVPYALADGRNWSQARERFVESCIDTLGELMPDLRSRIVGVKAMTPVELERELDLERSHITHGDMFTERLFGPRPHPMADDYRTPLGGFYLTGSGTWPGGYVTGVPGFNTSRMILADLKAKPRMRRAV